MASKHSTILHIEHTVLVITLLTIFTSLFFISDGSLTGAAVVFPELIQASDVINPIITFLDPTPANNTEETGAQSVEINISIEEDTQLYNFTWTWNETSYPLYNESLLVMLNFDNIASLGEGASTVVDHSLYGNNVTITGDSNEVVSNGKFDGYMDLDGNNDYAKTPTFTIGGEFTYSLWVKSDKTTYTGYTRILENNFATHSYLGTNQGGNEYKFIVDGPSAPYGTAQGGSIVQGQWQHLVATFDGSTGTLYVDGEIVGSDTFTNPGKVTDDLYIGTWQNNPGTYVWDGGIDELRVYNRSLSENEVYLLYASNLKKINTTNYEFYVNQSKNKTDGLDTGIFTYQAQAVDQSGNIAVSEERTFSTELTDIQEPSFTNIPDNVTLSYTQKFPELDFNATDNAAVTNFTVNDTTLFTINASGFLRNNTLLNIGTYVLEINVSDAQNNINSTLWQLDVVPDTFAPAFTDIPTNVSIYFHESLPELDFNASDDIAVTNFTVDNTDVFSMNETGSLTNISSLEVGVYVLNISVFDAQNNINSTSWQVEVNKTTPTLSLLADGSPNNFSIGETALFDINASVTLGDNNAITNLYQNGSLINSGTAQNLLYNGTSFDSQGSFEITFEYLESENYTSQNVTILATITYLDLLPPSIQFLDPTPTNGDTSLNDANILNVSIQEETKLQSFTHNWNGSNYTLYDESLLLMYNFDNITSLGDSASKAADNSHYQNNATLNGDAQIESNGRYENYLSLDGASDYAITPTITIGGIFTVSAWVRPDFALTATYPRILENSFQTHFFLGVNPDEEYQLIINDPSSPYGNAKGGSIVQGQWQHLVATFDGSTGTLYVDGEIVGSDTFTNPGKLTDEVYIGTHYQDPTIAEWNGGIDEVRIYNRSLSEGEVYTLYTSNLKKINNTYWEFEINQSKNATDVLDLGTYSYQAFAQDEYGNQNQTEQRTLTKGSVAIPELTNPINNSATTDRTPTFIWNNSEGSDLSYTYDLQVASDLGFLTVLEEQTNIFTNNATQSNVTLEQDLPVDTTVYVRVRAYGGSYSGWSEVYQIDTLSSNIVSLPTSSVDFGQITPSQEKNTQSTSGLEPIIVSNDGNIPLNIFLNSTTFFTDPSSVWQYQIEVNETSAYAAANESWLDVPVNIQDTLSIQSLFHENNSNTANRANIHLKIQAAVTEPAADLSSTIYIRSEASS